MKIHPIYLLFLILFSCNDGDSPIPDFIEAPEHYRLEEVTHINGNDTTTTHIKYSFGKWVVTEQDTYNENGQIIKSGWFHNLGYVSYHYGPDELLDSLAVEDYNAIRIAIRFTHTDNLITSMDYYRWWYSEPPSLIRSFEVRYLENEITVDEYSLSDQGDMEIFRTFQYVLDNGFRIEPIEVRIIRGWWFYFKPEQYLTNHNWISKTEIYHRSNYQVTEYRIFEYNEYGYPSRMEDESGIYYYTYNL